MTSASPDASVIWRRAPWMLPTCMTFTWKVRLHPSDKLTMAAGRWVASKSASSSECQPTLRSRPDTC